MGENVASSGLTSADRARIESSVIDFPPDEAFTSRLTYADRARIEEEERYRAEARVRAEQEVRQRQASTPQSRPSATSQERSRPPPSGFWQTSGRWYALGCLVGVGLLVSGVIALEVMHISDGPGGTDSRGNPIASPRSVAESLVDAWTRGESGGQFWQWGWEPQTLFAVTDYEYISSGEFPSGSGGWPKHVWCRFRIESSTKAGIPIRKLWDIDLDRRSDSSEWKVIAIRPSQ